MHTVTYTVPANVLVTKCPPGRCPGAGDLNAWAKRRRVGEGRTLWIVAKRKLRKAKRGA